MTERDPGAVSTPPFEMTVDLNVLEHLGMNLYSNIAAVLTEAVANAWDADAETVSIRVDPKQEWIEIADDGVGMSIADLNGKYLRVGYRRRDNVYDEHARSTAKNRAVMGRKGLGKLSLFSIADVIEVQSVQNGHKPAGFTMRVDGIKQAIAENKTYYPIPLPDTELTVTNGTRIVLREIKRRRLTQGIDALRKRLARRFSVIGESQGFHITIDGVQMTVADRGDLAKAQFLWLFDGTNLDPDATKHVLERDSIDSRSKDWDSRWNVRGWIGTAGKPKDLDSDVAGNLNGIVIFSRGRLIQENVLDRLNDGRFYTKYLTGQIEADFLDVDDQPDIATSDRQRLQEDDPRYIELIGFLKGTLDSVEKRWNEWRRKHEVRKVKERSPAIQEWLNGMPDGHKSSAETLIAKLSALPVENDEDRRDLYRHGIYAFERMKLRGSTEGLANHALDIEQLFRMLADRDALEASLYRDIVKSRLEAIGAFQGIVDEDTKEKVLQKYLFDHLWLLDPAWERATGSELMETRLLDKGVIVHDLKEKEKLGRVDIKYRTTAGKHILVELKKVQRKMKLLELQAQGQTYVDKLKKILIAQNEQAPNIEVVFVIGLPVDEEAENPDRLKSSMAAVSAGSRIIHYDTLINGARKAYAEYLQTSQALDKLERIIGSL
jgi:hypothetical protein